LSAARVLVTVARHGRALPAALRQVPPSQRPWVQEMSFGVLRWFLRLEAMLRPLLARPLRPRDADLHMLLLVGLYELEMLSRPPHAVVDESVRSAGRSGRPWARGLVNAVLRGWLRRRGEILPALEDDPEARTAHPAWLVERLRAAWPDDWARICEAGNARPPMTLRVNLGRTTRAAYRERLAAAGLRSRPVAGVETALVLERPVPVDRLPGFAEGLVSVQDAAAQLAALILDPRPGQRVLDACAAPGGKTGHLLEQTPEIELLALDREPARLRQVDETLRRLGLTAAVGAADAAATARWWDGRPFDRVLLDAPCSATGIVRRQPDVKLHRAPEQIPGLAARQRALLEALWPTVAPGGRLLYATCSVLPEENAEQIAAFLAAHPEARPVPFAAGPVRAADGTVQILPGEHDMDGFYYALLEKNNT
jgi:16S rRNA (cytosine967-C5)-methyltransferase